MKQGFLGRGWSFPPTFSQDRGAVEMLEEQADIVSSLKILLGTAQGERVLQPLFGCNLEELVFESLDTRIKTLMADKVESAILYNETRIDLEDVTLDDSLGLKGVTLIKVTYRVRSTNSRFNFVYPYYRLEGTDINMITTVNLLPDKG